MRVSARPHIFVRSPVTSPADLPRHVSHFDPSWCARINAHRRPAEPAAAPPPPRQQPDPEPPASAPAPAEPWPFKLREIPAEHVCERCGTVMYDHNCKIVCPNCGYKRDCSDP